ncbi:MAG: integrase core domain-containing protein [Holosporaceae bacterium]|nr:integrase core domain-containing protein [Holosporaceae bacterium]
MYTAVLRSVCSYKFLEISLFRKKSNNVHIERFWRSIKYENVFLIDFQSVSEAKDEIKKFINFYNYTISHY